jgi:trimethylamine--corrinoid protein Co-methyltransferase
MEGALTVSKEGLLLDAEIIEGIYRVLRGVEVQELTLAGEVIRTVGPGGHFLKQRHTMQFLQAEHFLPLLANRQTRERWEQGGSRSMADQAHSRVQQLLEEHKADALPPAMEAELQRIVSEVEKREAQ